MMVAVQAQETAVPLRNADELDQLLAPIALYPDPLVALILPASTMPDDVADVVRRINGGLDEKQIAASSWDESLKGLAHYPKIVRWMNDNMPWTWALGEAVVNQKFDVMQSIQRLRRKALAAGNLVNTTHEDVVVEDGAIRIEPAQSSSINIPAYDPTLAYSEPAVDVSSSLIDYGSAYPVGDSLTFDCDWAGGGIWYGGSGWRYARQNGRLWQCRTNRAAFRTDGTASFGIPHPGLVPGTPALRHFVQVTPRGGHAVTNATNAPAGTTITLSQPPSALETRSNTSGQVSAGPGANTGTSVLRRETVGSRPREATEVRNGQFHTIIDSTAPRTGNVVSPRSNNGGVQNTTVSGVKSYGVGHSGSTGTVIGGSVSSGTGTGSATGSGSSSSTTSGFGMGGGGGHR